MNEKEEREYHKANGYMNGYEACKKEMIEKFKPVVEALEMALTCSRAANNKNELWEAWADNLEEKTGIVLESYRRDVLGEKE